MLSPKAVPEQSIFSYCTWDYLAIRQRPSRKEYSLIDKEIVALQTTLVNNEFGKEFKKIATCTIFLNGIAEQSVSIPN